MGWVVYWVTYAATQTVIGAFVLKAAIAYVLTVAARELFEPDAPERGVRDNTVTVIDSLSTRKLIYGQARVGGTIVYAEVTNSSYYLHLIVAFAGHEVESFDKFYFDDIELTLSGNTVTSPGQYYSADDSAYLVNIYPHLGSDSQIVDTALDAQSLNWTANHRLRGIAYAYIRLRYYPKAFPGGIPNITALISGKKVYDPRTGLTAWSDNAALCSADYLMDTRYGLGIPADDVDMPTLSTAADTCDESVTLLAGGTESRYTCNGVVDTGDSPKNIIEALSTAKGAATVCMMGKWYVLAGEYRTPALSFDEDDIASPLQIQTRHTRNTLFNHVKGTYSSPDNQWQPTDYPIVKSTTYLAQDNNEIIWVEKNLPYTVTASMAQRLGLLALNRARRQITVTALFRMSALDAIPSDTVKLTIDRMGWNEKVFEVQDWRFAVDDEMRLGIEMVLRETDSSVYSWSTADESAANASPTTNLPNYSVIAAPTNLSVSTEQIPTGTGADETYRAILTWTAPDDAFVVSGGLIEVQYKKTAESIWRPSWYVDGAQTTAEINMLELSTSYDVRIRSYNNIAKSDWIAISGFVVLGSGGFTTSQDWGEWVSTPGACGASPSCDFGEWVSSPGTTYDLGSWT